MDEQKIELQFQVDTAQVSAAVKGQKELKAAVEDTGEAAKKAAKATVDAEAKKAAEIEAIETKFLAAEYRRQVKREQDAIKASEAAVAAAEKAAARIAAANKKALDQTGTGANSAAYKLQQFGQTLDDLQYVGEQGLRPILNNLMQISPVLGIAAIAVSTVGIPAIKALWESFNTTKVRESGETIDELKAKIETLEKNPTRLTFENAELDATKKKLDEAVEAKRTLDALLGNQSENEKKSGQAVRESLASPAGREAVKLAKEANAANVSPEDQERLANAKALAAGAEKSVKRLTAQRDDPNASDADKTSAAFSLNAVAMPLYNKAAEAVQRIEAEIKAKADASFAEVTRQAISGVGDKQAEAQEELARRLRATAPFGVKEVGQGLGQDVADSSVDVLARKKREKEAEEASGLDAEGQFDRVEESNARAKAFRLKQAAERKKDLKEQSDDAEAQFASVEESNARAKAFRLKMRAAAKKENTEQTKAVKEFVDQFDGKAILNTIGQSMSQGMSDDALKEHTAKFLAKNTSIPPEQRAAVAAGLVGKVRENFDAFKAERAAMGMQFGGQALGGMPQFQGGKRLVGKRNMALRAKARAKSKGAAGLPEIKPFRGLAPVPSIGKMPELKIDGFDKSASLMQSQDDKLGKLIDLTEDGLRAKSTAVLG